MNKQVEQIRSEIERLLKIEDMGYEDGDVEHGYKCCLHDIKRFIDSMQEEQRGLSMDSFWYYGIDGGNKWLLIRDNKGVLKYKINLTLIGLEHIKTYDELIEFVGVNEYPIQI